MHGDTALMGMGTRAPWCLIVGIEAACCPRGHVCRRAPSTCPIARVEHFKGTVHASSPPAIVAASANPMTRPPRRAVMGAAALRGLEGGRPGSRHVLLLTAWHSGVVDLPPATCLSPAIRLGTPEAAPCGLQQDG